MKTRSNFSFAVCLSISLLISGRAEAAEAEAFAKSLENTRAVVAKHHLISLVEISPLDEGKETKYRYDRYPEVERLQLNGASYARKKPKSWLKSDNWAETGAKVKTSKAQELDALVSFVDAPLNNNMVARDKSQGGMVVHLLNREPRDKSERIFYEIRRENSTGLVYPKFVFDKGKDEADDEALLVGYAGLMYSGDEKVKVNINYSYMFLVAMEPAKAKDSTTRPAPSSEKVYNFTELDLQKFDLKDKVVRVEVGPKVIQSNALSDGMKRLMVKDTAKPVAFYGMVDFPKDGIDKLGLGTGRKENVTLYILVKPRSKDEVAQLIALGTRFTPAAGGGGYSWE